jgi:type II secretory pathway component GspD/PulD (secretin)
MKSIIIYLVFLSAASLSLYSATNTLPAGATSTGTPPSAVESTASHPATTNTPEMIQLNFQDTDIMKIIGYLSELTGETIIPDPSVKGTVTIFSPKPVSRKKAKQVIYSALFENGYTIVRQKHVIKVKKVGDAKTSPIPTVRSRRTTKN